MSLPKDPKPYARGDYLPGAIIVAALPGATVRSNRYLLRWDCCGSESVMSHSQVYYWITGNKAARSTNYCKRCSYQHRGHNQQRPMAASASQLTVEFFKSLAAVCHN